MTSAKSDSTNRHAPAVAGQDAALFGIVCAVVIVFFGWIAHSALLSVRPQPENTLYNLLVQGFRAGHLSVAAQTPPELAKAANPYVPAAFAPYTAQVFDLSYYHGKLYLYWGLTPVLLLFWPYNLLTGQYLSDADAITIFLSLGFLIAAGMLNAIRRRYFSNTPIWLALVSIFALGLVLAAQEMEWQFCAIYEVALSCGFAFAMASLAALWQALHRPAQQGRWLMLASLAYGLAIGSRPSLLFGAVILLIPVVPTWRAAKAGSPSRMIPLLAAAVVPVALIVVALMAYNQLRFDSPFEFGWRYQLNTDRLGPGRQFSPHYFFSDVYYYFLKPIHWSRHFPFVQTIPEVTLPSGYSPVGKSYGGILLTIPLVWLALATPRPWRDRLETADLRWFATVVFLLFITGALTICLFANSYTRYALDFLPALLLLSFIGIFALERAFRDSPARRAVRAGWGALLAMSVALNILAGIAALADAYAFGASVLVREGRASDAIAFYQKALALSPGSAQFHFALGSAYHQAGWDESAVAEFQTALELDPALPQAALMRENVADYFFNAGQMDIAIEQYQKALAINPHLAAAQYNLGLALYKTGHADEAIPHLQKALELQPSLAGNESATDADAMAWLFATNPDPAKRNGALAVTLAESACQKTASRMTAAVGTLAAAYARAGRFDDAISAAQKAITLAKQNGEAGLLQENQELLALYLKHEPYTEEASSPQ
jgi:tetratricopeptide (TPR) repeat protein